MSNEHINTNINSLTDEDIEMLDLTDQEDELLGELDFNSSHHYVTESDTVDEYYALYESGVDDSIEDILDGLHIDNPGVVDYE